jgi:hypothetical protein
MRQTEIWFHERLELVDSDRRPHGGQGTLHQAEMNRADHAGMCRDEVEERAVVKSDLAIVRRDPPFRGEPDLVQQPDQPARCLIIGRRRLV